MRYGLATLATLAALAVITIGFDKGMIESSLMLTVLLVALVFMLLLFGSLFLHAVIGQRR